MKAKGRCVNNIKYELRLNLFLMIWYSMNWKTNATITTEQITNTKRFNNLILRFSLPKSLHSSIPIFEMLYHNVFIVIFYDLHTNMFHSQQVQKWLKNLKKEKIDAILIRFLFYKKPLVIHNNLINKNLQLNRLLSLPNAINLQMQPLCPVYRLNKL